MNDAVLLERWVQRRDAEAFNEIVSRFADQVYGTCRNILRNDADAEEVAQECFLLLVRSGDEVRASLGGWLHRVATTKSLDRIRGEARRRKYEQALAEETQPHTEATWDDIQEHVDAAIDTLPEDLREVIVAHFIGRKNHGEIARELRLTRRAVSYRIQRGVEALRSELVRRGVTASCAGLGALLLAQALPAAPLSLKASLGKLALAAGLPAGTGAGATIAASAVGSLILMKARVVFVAAIVCAVIGLYVATRPDDPAPPAEIVAALPAEEPRDGAVDNMSPDPGDATKTEAILTSAPVIDPAAQVVTEEHRGIITGVVLLPTGLPAQGATVRYTWKPNPREASVEGLKSHEGPVVETGELGQFSFTEIPRGRIYITASHPTGQVTEQITTGYRALVHDITLVLMGGERIAGTVVARDGEGIANARIMPLLFDGEAIHDREIEGRAVVSDSKGAFEFLHLMPGQWTFRATAVGFGAETTEPIATGTVKVQVVLAPGTDLACRVVDAASQKPLGGVNATLKYIDDQSVFTSATSDAQGLAIFTSLGRGSYTLDVDHPRYALAGPPVPAEVDPARKSPAITMELVEGGQIHGRVFDSASGGGIAHVVVRASSSATDRSFTSAPSDKEGRYSLAGLPDGDYRIGTAGLPPIYSRERPTAPQLVTIAEGSKVEAADFALSAGASLGGIVLDTDGNPVAGAQVQVKSEHRGVVLGDLYTQEDGRFAVGDFEAGESIMLSAQSRVANSGLLGPYLAGDPGSEAIEVVLSRACTGTITGRVTDSQGRPFPCRLHARAEEPELRFPVMPLVGEADGLGSFVLSGACSGTYTIDIIPERTERQSSEPIRVEAGQIVSGVSLIYDSGQLFEIAGIVVDEDENPIAGARVSARRSTVLVPSEISDENGAFRFKDLEAGRYQLEASAEGYGKQSMGFAEAGDMDAVVQIMSAATISGRVTDALGRPVANFLVSLAVEGRPEHTHVNQRFSDESGAFSLEVPSNGEWRVRVESEGYATTEVVVDFGAIDGGASDMEIVLEAAQ